MKKTVAIVLMLCMLLGMVSMTAAAVDVIPGDVNGDGKVTPYDALQVQGYLHGEISLTDEQIERAIAACDAIPTLSTAHIVAIFFKPLVGQNSQAPEEDGLYHIRSTADLALLRSFPYAGFSLDADLDMTGTSWTPVIFNGALLGNGHTISNLTVTAATTNINAGALFTKLGSASNGTAIVKDLTLASATLTTASAHKYAGLLAGSNYGTISNVSVDGGTITGAINATNAVGALAGMNYGAVTSALADFTISYSCNNAELVGTNEVGASASSIGSYSIKKNGVIVSDRTDFTDTSASREAVLGYMEDMSKVEWTYPYASVTYRDSTNAALSDYTVNSGTIYHGMKYGHEAASLEAMLDQMTLVGSTYQVNQQFASYPYEDKSVWNEDMTGKLIMGHYFSNDCSSSIGWAWSLVSGTYTGERTTRMAPTAYNISRWGVVKVGNYDMTRSDAEGSHRTAWCTGDSYQDPKVRSILTDADGNLDLQNLNALYESYALLQPGDALIHNDRFYVADGTKSTDGHSKMVRSVNVVRNGDGSINPTASTISTVECGGGGTKIYTNTQWCYNTWSFEVYAAYKSSTKSAISGTTIDDTARYRVYVPCTTIELAQGYRPASYIQLKDASSPFSGIVSSNYRIEWTSVTIDGVTDKSYTGTQPLGTTFDNPYEGLDDSGFTSAATIRGITNSRHEASRLLYKSVNLAKHAEAFSTLASGTHNYSITVKLATGETKTWEGTFTN